MFVSGQVTASDPLGERRARHFQTQLWWLPSATTAVSYLGLQVFRVDRCFQELVRCLAAGVSPATSVSETCTRGAPRCHRYAGIDPQDFRELSCAFMSWYGLWISSVIPLKLAADQWFSNCLGANGGGTFTPSRVSVCTFCWMSLQDHLVNTVFPTKGSFLLLPRARVTGGHPESLEMGGGMPGDRYPCTILRNNTDGDVLTALFSFLLVGW